MVPNSPLRFSPVFRSYIWGGSRLASVLGKSVPSDGIWAESWEVVDHGADQSVVSEGRFAGWSLHQLIESFPDEILGQHASQFKTFPLLLKYLDCQRVLSVQVHPNDGYAKKMTPPDLGKTEAWYVVDAQPDAKIYAGLKQDIDRAQLAQAIAEGRTEDCLHVVHAKAGDCIFIPAGTVHALGDGLLIAEIQQASDTTFRLFDWNRVDADGKPRPLHIEQALDVIDYASGPVAKCSAVDAGTTGLSNLVTCDKFVLQKCESSQSYSLPQDGRFRIVTVPKGVAQLTFGDQVMSLEVGQTVLVPADHVPVSLRVHDHSQALLMSLP
jgi:mannose-6-phosphate isomerase